MSLTKAERELEQFLIKHPHLIGFQRRLDKAMNEVRDEYRIEVLKFYIQDNLDQLKTEFLLLQNLINKVGKND
jgi:hypothetical protein